jgi:hypothetical protein
MCISPVFHPAHARLVFTNANSVWYRSLPQGVVIWRHPSSLSRSWSFSDCRGNVTCRRSGPAPGWRRLPGSKNLDKNHDIEIRYRIPLSAIHCRTKSASGICAVEAK